MNYRLIHTALTIIPGKDAGRHVHEVQYRSVEAIERFLKKPWHPWSGEYDRWEDGELQTEWFSWDIIRDKQVMHAVRGADARSQEALVEACRRMGLSLPGGET